MKGSNKLLLNNAQLCAVIQEWWDRHTLNTMSAVITQVGYNEREFVFEINMVEKPEEK